MSGRDGSSSGNKEGPLQSQPTAPMLHAGERAGQRGFGGNSQGFCGGDVGHGRRDSGGKAGVGNDEFDEFGDDDGFLASVDIDVSRWNLFHCVGGYARGFVCSYAEMRAATAHNSSPRRKVRYTSVAVAMLFYLCVLYKYTHGTKPQNPYICLSLGWYLACPHCRR